MNRMEMKKTLWFPVLLVAAVSFSGSAQAQPGPVHTGSIEVGVFGAGQFGDVADVSAGVVAPGFKIAGASGGGGGFNIGIAMNRRFVFQGEASFADGGGRQYSTVAASPTPFFIQTSTRAWIYEADLNMRFQPKSSKFVPYLLIGGAGIQTRADALVTNSNPAAIAPNPANTALQTSFRQTTFAPALGAGFRQYVTPKFGFRMELKGYFPTGDVKSPFSRLSGGVFFQFK